LVPEAKAIRVASYHHQTIESLCEMLGALGIASADDLRPWHIMHRISPTETRHYGELYDFLKCGELLGNDIPDEFRRAMNAATADSFGHVEIS